VVRAVSAKRHGPRVVNSYNEALKALARLTAPAALFSLLDQRIRVTASACLRANPSAHACVYGTAAASDRAEHGHALLVKRTKSATKRTSNPVEMRDARSRALYSFISDIAALRPFCSSAEGRLSAPITA
jgi:hypothetical protein